MAEIDILNDTLIIIPSARKPPVKTLLSYPTERCVVILADPDLYEEHEEYHYGPNVNVAKGKKGLIPQVLELYRWAHVCGFKYFFRLDDDIQHGFFVDIDRNLPDLEFVMQQARLCIEATETSLAGFANTSRVDWLDYGFSRSSGLIHGGAQICISSSRPEQFLDPNLPRYEDVYRSAAHRERDGAVGRVNWIGLNKRESLRDSAAAKSPEITAKAKEIILTRFPTMVTCHGNRILDGGRQVIPNWRMKGRAT